MKGIPVIAALALAICMPSASALPVHGGQCIDLGSGNRICKEDDTSVGGGPGKCILQSAGHYLCKEDANLTAVTHGKCHEGVIPGYYLCKREVIDSAERKRECDCEGPRCESCQI